MMRRRLSVLMMAGVLPGFVAAADLNMPKIPEPAPKLGQGLPHDVFVGAVNANRPISADQVGEIIDLRKQLNDALSRRVGSTAKPVSQSVQISLSAGSTPHPVRTSLQTLTSLVFLDSTGAPWPIVDFAAGNGDALSLPAPADIVGKKLHVITLAPKQEFVSTNLTVMLEGAAAPVTLSIVSSKKVVDYRLDLRVQGRGPNATSLASSSTFSEYLPPELINVLDGKPGDGAVELEVSGDNTTRVWKSGTKFYVRTRLQLIAPAAPNLGRGADGTNVYEVPPTPRVIALRNGEQVSLSITGY